MALTDNWEASWRYNNDFSDSSGNGITGSAIGTTFSSSIKKLGSHAAEHDGVNDAVNYGNVLNSVFAGADKKFSFSFWLYMNNLDIAQQYFNKYGDSSHGEDQRQFFVYVGTDGKIHFRVYFDLLGNTSREYVTPASTITAGSFHLIRMTYDGSIDTNDGLDRCTIKVNNINKALSMSSSGALVAIPSGTARLATGGAIGSSGSTVIDDLDGFIDQGDIWSRILTSQDDTDMWNGGAGIEIDGILGIGALVNGGLINNGLTEGRLIG